MKDVDPNSPLLSGMSVDRMVRFLRFHYQIPEAELESLRLQAHQAQQRFAEQWPAMKEYLHARAQ